MLKKGEIYICIKSLMNCFTKGKIYECTEDNHLMDENGIDVFFDNKEIMLAEYFETIGNSKYKTTDTPFVYYRGDPERGNEILKILKELGGISECNIDCANEKFYYFIAPSGRVAYVEPEEEEWVLKHYSEGQLPKIEKPAFGPFDKILYIGKCGTKWQPTEYRNILDYDGHVCEDIKKVIPYIEETEYLSYSIMDCPEKYKV